MDRDTERELIRRAQAGDIGARDELVASLMQAVGRIASRFSGRGMDVEDLIQEGALGAVRAIERHDVASENRLYTYAQHWIEGYIRRALDRYGGVVRLSRGTAGKLRRLRHADEHGEDHGFSELVEGRLRADSAMRTVSLDTPVTDGGASSALTLHDIVGEEAGQEDGMNVAALHQAIGELTAQEQAVIRALLGDDEPTLADVGKRLGVSRERVRQVQSEALKKLRRRLGTSGPARQGAAGHAGSDGRAGPE